MRKILTKLICLNDYFSGKTVLDESQNTLPKFIFRNRHSLDPHEVEETLNSLSVGKAAGPDGINNKLLKQLSKPLSKSLSDLFNFSLVHGKVPTTWKGVNISPILKKWLFRHIQIRAEYLTKGKWSVLSFVM